MSRLGEFEWISKYLAPLASPNSFGLNDDAAILPVPANHELVVTQDAIAENVHFLSDDPIDLVVRKALRVNVSDVVAKGAKPFAYSMALGMPDTWNEVHMKRFAEGMAMDQAAYGLKLTGGDTYASPNGLCISVTMFGAAQTGHYKSRLSARSGDILAVSGTIGNGALGLKVATGKLTPADEIAAPLLRAYRLPNPPAALAAIIAQFSTASMDVSDGLIGDCAKLCKASGVSANISRVDIPIEPGVRKLVDENPLLWRDVLTGGDDYQVLCSVAPDNWNTFQQNSAKVGVNVTAIGQLTDATSTPVLLDMGGLEVSLRRDSYSHF